MDNAWTKSAVEQFGFTQEQAEAWLVKWRGEHYAGDTMLSYIDWLKHKIAAAQEALIITADQALDVFQSCGHTADNDIVVKELLNIISLVAPSLAALRERIRKEASK